MAAMRILIMKDAAQNYWNRCHSSANRIPVSMMFSQVYMDSLKEVQGRWIEVECEHLFRDQFNIPEGAENGMRIFLRDVEAIENDIRIGLDKCGWCGGYCKRGENKCQKCGKSEYLQPMLLTEPQIL